MKIVMFLSGATGGFLGSHGQSEIVVIITTIAAGVGAVIGFHAGVR
jgi:hypothetical protein